MDKVILREKMTEYLRENNENQLADFLSSPRKKLVYGRGIQAVATDFFCTCTGITFEAFLCSDKGTAYNSNDGRVLPDDIPVYTPDEIDAPAEYDVVLSLSEKHHSQIIDKLEKCGFSHIYYSNNWVKTNRIFRKYLLELYLRQYLGASFSVSAPVIEYGDFKIYGIQEPEEYSSMLLGEFFDCIAPSLFDDKDFVIEGGYEEGRVCLEKNDIVFDLGANIGMFSCVAAAKGKKVYAFEPVPGTAEYLRKNAGLYDNFEVVDAAVSDKDGECNFTINDLSSENYNIGANTMFSERISYMPCKTIKVKTVTLDSFVKEHGIERVDFIKADIEGAERYMLEGAKEVLKKFAPKLALCTYHLPDDPQVMRDIILKYNPDYVIEQHEKKMYAYVES